jgi:hypothetical protein
LEGICAFKAEENQSLIQTLGEQEKASQLAKEELLHKLSVKSKEAAELQSKIGLMEVNHKAQLDAVNIKVTDEKIKDIEDRYGRVIEGLYEDIGQQEKQIHELKEKILHLEDKNKKCTHEKTEVEVNSNV